MARKYNNPPVVEAVCEFRFSPETNWVSSLSDRIYENLSSHYSIREVRNPRQIKVSATESNTDVETIAKQRRRDVFLSEDKKKFVQVGKHFLFVNCLKSYIGWGKFKPMISDAFEALSNIVNPQDVERIVLRYINRIEIPDSEQDGIGEFFNIGPYLGPDLPHEVTSFITGAVFPFVDKDYCVVEIKDGETDREDYSAIRLNLEYSTMKPIAKQDVESWIETAHDRMESIFEGCITDQLREIFGEVK